MMQTTKQIFAWLCIRPFDNSMNRWSKIVYIIFAGCVFSANLCTVAASVAFFTTFMLVCLKECLYSLIQIAAYSCVSYAMLTMFIQRNKINNVFSKLKTIYNSSKKILKLNLHCKCICST